MTQTTVPERARSALPARILDALKAAPNQKAAELADWLGAKTQDVVRSLTEMQGISVEQDALYRWRLKIDDEAQKMAAKGSSRAEIARSCLYYMDCLGQDADLGVSVFAKPMQNMTEYAQLEGHPGILTDDGQAPLDADWHRNPDVRRVLDQVSADRRNLEAWVGYPTRLRWHETQNWKGFMVEPIMLWRVVFGTRGITLEEGMPQINFSFMRHVALGGASEVVEESASLGAELGLNNLPKDQPSAEELLLRMVNVRPEWDWAETIDPRKCSNEALSSIAEGGIYNQAIVVASKRSAYTQGLETELKTLSNTQGIDYLGTSLDQWFTGQFFSTTYEQDRENADQPLLEVVPMNTEQRAAVRSALVEPLTVVTGPPGTGKSQVVTNLLINAAWRGMKVLFASKNNKAVDVVEERVNSMGERPILLRLGSAEYQEKLSKYFGAMFANPASAQDKADYEQRLAKHQALLNQAAMLDGLQMKTIDTRNYVDAADQELEGFRSMFSREVFGLIEPDGLEVAGEIVTRFLAALNYFNVEHASLFDRLFGYFLRKSRLAELSEALSNLVNVGAALEQPMPEDFSTAGYDELKAFAQDVSLRIAAADGIVSYKNALETLLMSPSLEDITRQRIDVMKDIARNSAGLWKDWVRLVPTKLSDTERKDVNEYATLLKAMNEPGAAKMMNGASKARSLALHQKMTTLFTCWAVTSLSVRGKVPLEPGYVDLVVIDEAGQCDIASAIPLLYRARRAVIIGDPKQLKHISSLNKQKDMALQERRQLTDRATWLYSTNSLYDLAASLASRAQVIELRDHHRCHADIIEYSNVCFYNGALRVATPYNRLKIPKGALTGISWVEVQGECVRPKEGGLRNQTEAEAVVAALYKLLVDEGYEGTVGVVTPFRAQATLIQSLIYRNSALLKLQNKAELIVDTAHRFQGDERDVIMLSLVIGDQTPSSALTFMRNNANLFNVAVTRARAHLKVVGNFAALKVCTVDYLQAFATYYQGLQAHVHENLPEEEDLGRQYPAVANPHQVTQWEEDLYSALYDVGIHATPQYTVEKYDLDLALIVGDRKLAIEVDGERYHSDWNEELCLRDQLRNQRLFELGWEVKRFWVYEIRDRLEDCVGQVFDWARQAQADTKNSTPHTKA